MDSLTEPSLWMRALDAELAPEEQLILSRFGINGIFGEIAVPSRVQVGLPVHQPRGAVLDVQWQSGNQRNWEPTMQADVTLSALSGSVTHLEFNGCYCRSSLLSTTPANRVAQHRVLEFAVRLILERLAWELQYGLFSVAG